MEKSWLSRGWAYFIKFSVTGFSTPKKMDPIGSKVFVKMRGQKDPKSMKKGVNLIENQGEN